jgi:hypothetical protein
MKIARFCSSSAIVPFLSTLLQTDGTRPSATLRAAPHLEQLAVTRNGYTVFRTAQPVAVLSFERWSNRSRLRRPCWAQRDSNRPVKPHLENPLAADPDDMPTPFVGTLGPLGVVLLLSMTASAQQAPEETKSPPSNEIERHVFNYGDHDKTCNRWTDKCRICNRNISADIVCSNIGIACQPADVECLERQKSDDKE